MNITKVTVKKIEGQQMLRGVASVVLDDEIKIRDIKILERESGLSTAPKPQEEKQPDTKGSKIVRLFKKHWLKTLLILLCVYFSFFLFGMLVSDYYVDENGVRQPIVLSMDYLADREDYTELRSHYDAIEELVVDITILCCTYKRRYA